MSLESEVQENTRTMKDMLSQMRGGTRYNPPGSNTSGGSDVDITGLKTSFWSAEGAIENFVSKLVRQQAGIPDASDIVIKGISPLFGKLSDVLGNAFGGVIRYMDETVKNWQDFSKLGPTMYGNAINVNEAFGKMRLDYNEFADVIKGMGTGGLSFGKTMSEATMLFSSSVDYFANSDYQKNFQMLGIKEKERAELMGTIIRGWTGLNLSNSENMEIVAKRTSELGKQMALAAEITGVTREKQMDAMREFQTDLRTQAAREEHTLNGDNIYAELSGKVSEAVRYMPAAVRDAALQASANNGQVYGKTQETMNLLAPRTLAMIQEQGRILSDVTRSNEERTAAAKRLEEAQFSFTAEIMTNGTRQYTKYEQITTEQATALKEIAGFRDAVNNMIAKNPGMTLEAAMKQLVASGEFTVGGRKTAPERSGQPGEKPGEEDPGRQSTMAYLNVQNRIKDIGERSITVIGDFNRDIGKAGQNLELFNLNPAFNSGKGMDVTFKTWLDKVTGGKPVAPSEMQSHFLKFIQSMSNSAVPKNVEDIKPQDRHGYGGSSSAGVPSIFGEYGFEYKADDAANRVYNNGQTKTLIASMTDGMRMFPILSSQLQKVAPEVAQVVSTAMSEKTSSGSASQDSLITEVKKLNTTMEAVAGFTKGTVDAVKQSVKAIQAADSVYG